jgi:hypothetical protein
MRNGVPADRLRWIMPRDSWLMNRATVQPGAQFLDRLKLSIATRMQAITDATDLDDLFRRLELDENLFRLDPSVRPEMYHCAIVSPTELEHLRAIRDVVRLGHLDRVEADRLVCRDGTVEVTEPSLYIDSTTPGLPRPPEVPVFDGDRIVLQSVRGCQQVFSAAFIAHVEAAYGDGENPDAARNALCAPVMHPDAPLDWLRMTKADNAAQLRWVQDPELMEWLSRSRLNILRDIFPAFPANPRVREKALGALAAVLNSTNDKLSALMAQAR